MAQPQAGWLIAVTATSQATASPSTVPATRPPAPSTVRSGPISTRRRTAASGLVAAWAKARRRSPPPAGPPPAPSPMRRAVDRQVRRQPRAQQRPGRKAGQRQHLGGEAAAGRPAAPTAPATRSRSDPAPTGRVRPFRAARWRAMCETPCMDLVNSRPTPKLRAPRMVAAFRGWNDAGGAASLGGWLPARRHRRRAVRRDRLRARSSTTSRRGRTVTLTDGQVRDVEWPETEIFGLRAARHRDRARHRAEHALARVH